MGGAEVGGGEGVTGAAAGGTGSVSRSVGKGGVADVTGFCSSTSNSEISISILSISSEKDGGGVVLGGGV